MEFLISTPSQCTTICQQPSHENRKSAQLESSNNDLSKLTRKILSSGFVSSKCTFLGNAKNSI